MASSPRLFCVHCGQPIEVADATPGRETTCPACGKSIRLPNRITPPPRSEARNESAGDARTFHYEARDADGDLRWGTVKAGSVKEAFQCVRDLGLFPSHVTESGSSTRHSAEAEESEANRQPPQFTNASGAAAAILGSVIFISWIVCGASASSRPGWLAYIAFPLAMTIVAGAMALRVWRFAMPIRRGIIVGYGFALLAAIIEFALLTASSELARNIIAVLLVFLSVITVRVACFPPIGSEWPFVRVSRGLALSAITALFLIAALAWPRKEHPTPEHPQEPPYANVQSNSATPQQTSSGGPPSQPPTQASSDIASPGTLAPAPDETAVEMYSSREFQQAIRFLSQDDYTNALPILRRIAEQSDDKDPSLAAAEHNLGNCYAFGWGTPKDQKRAFEYYGRSSRHGSVEATFRLGSCYENGWGVQTDLPAALEKYRLAASRGHAKASERLQRLQSAGSDKAFLPALVPRATICVPVSNSVSGMVRPFQQWKLAHEAQDGYIVFCSTPTDGKTLAFIPKVDRYKSPTADIQKDLAHLLQFQKRDC